MVRVALVSSGFCRVIPLIGFLLLGMGSAAAEDAGLDAYLDRFDERYSEEHHMVGTEWGGPGYHSTVPRGEWVHQTRQSLDYALALLKRDESGDAERAAKVVRKVLTLQDTDPDSDTYGIWPWLLEEPLEEMSPPDWNWADFCGARLAQMLIDHDEKLPEDLAGEMRESVGHAAEAIRRRNVGPGYTNIAIMGGGVTAAAGELLDDAEMLEYGRDRLQRIVAHTEHHGGFSEYNSPTYTLVSLHECERTLQLVEDPATREAAEALRRILWETIADSFHPATQQWAGPHSRAYADRLRASAAVYLADQTGLDIQPHPSQGGGSSADPGLIDHLPCPSDLVDRFRELPDDPLELDRTFVRRDSAASSTTGTTWHTADACLGSVNRAALWTQRRPLIGYWKTERDPAVVLRLRFLKDGEDFASVGVRNGQAGGRALSVLYTHQRRGDWHRHLDRPEDGVFQATDLRMRYELRGEGVEARRLDEGRFELIAGDRRAVIHAPAGVFAGRAVSWELGEEDGKVFLDAVCYEGPEKDFDFMNLQDVSVGAGLELLGEGESASGESPVVEQPEPGRIEASWDVAGGLEVGGETSVR